jgi:hypothetical protein
VKFEGGELVYLYSSSAGHSTASFRVRIVARPGSQQLQLRLFLLISHLLEISIGHCDLCIESLNLSILILELTKSRADCLQRTPLRPHSYLCRHLSLNITHVIIMTELQQTTTRWSKSFPTVVSVPLSQYTCHYERGPNICKKTFTRECDLRFVLPLTYPIPL